MGKGLADGIQNHEVRDHLFYQDEEAHPRTLHHQWAYTKIAKTEKFLGVILSENLAC